MTGISSRIRMIPYEPAQLLALIEGVSQFEAHIGFKAAEGLRDFLVSGEVSPAWLERLHASTQADPWEHGFAVLHRDNNLVIATASFIGKPDVEGVVEIAYAVAPDWQGQGYATEVVRELLAFAGSDARVRRVRAHTLPGPNASTRVLEKSGFQKTREFEDPTDGPVWRWEREVAPTTATFSH